MTIAYSVFLIIYLAIVAFFLLFSTFNIYNIVRFGYMQRTAVMVTLAYLLLVAGIMVATWGLLREINWTNTLEIGSPFTQITE